MGLYTARVSAVALTASTTKTLLQVITGANRPGRVVEMSVSFDGVDASKTPIQVDLLLQTTAGTSSALTLVKDNRLSEAVQATALQTFTVEPTASDVYRSWYVTPANGLWALQWPLGREIQMNVSERVGIRCIVPAGTSCNATATLTFEE